MINAKNIAITKNGENQKKFKPISVKNLMNFMHEHVDMGDLYSICVGEDGDIFLLQQNTGFANRDYDYISVLSSCHIDFRSFYDDDGIDYESVSDEERERGNSEIRYFFIERTILGLADCYCPEYDIDFQ